MAPASSLNGTGKRRQARQDNNHKASPVLDQSNRESPLLYGECNGKHVDGIATVCGCPIAPGNLEMRIDASDLLVLGGFASDWH